jgi:hypothetical protein
MGSGVVARGTHSIGSWVDPRAGLDVTENSKVSLPVPGMEPPFALVVRLVA